MPCRCTPAPSRACQAQCRSLVPSHACGPCARALAQRQRRPPETPPLLELPHPTPRKQNPIVLAWLVGCEPQVLLLAHRLATEAAAQHAAEAANQVATATAFTAQTHNPIFLRPANGVEPAAASSGPVPAPIIIT